MLLCSYWQIETPWKQMDLPLLSAAHLRGKKKKRKLSKLSQFVSITLTAETVSCRIWYRYKSDRQNWPNYSCIKNDLPCIETMDSALRIKLQFYQQLQLKIHRDRQTGQTGLQFNTKQNGKMVPMNFSWFLQLSVVSQGLVLQGRDGPNYGPISPASASTKCRSQWAWPLFRLQCYLYIDHTCMVSITLKPFKLYLSIAIT